MELSDLALSEKSIGQIYPVVCDANGKILDGFHRKRENQNWKEVTLPIKDELDGLRIRVHLNAMRRDVLRSEKEEWVRNCREILQKRGSKGTQKEVGLALGLSRRWVSKYDEPLQIHPKVAQHTTFYGYNVWGFKDNSWRKSVVEADPNQPDVGFYHGSTPAFVIHNLIGMYEPKTVLDSMAGIGTTGYVCNQYDVECDLFDVYPYEKYAVQEGDAEFIDNGKAYDLIFNHIPYLDMVTYGKSDNDLSNMNEKDFMEKLKRIFLKNYYLLNKDGVFAVLVGDKRFAGRLVPLTAKTTQVGIEVGFALYDEAIKLTREQKSTGLQEYRASKYGYMAQTFDTVLIFKKGD